MAASSFERRYTPAIILLLLAALVVVIALWASERSGGIGALAGRDGVQAGSGDQARYNWKIVTTWPKNLPGLGSGPENFARMVGEMSNGRLTARVYGAGEMVPAFEVFDAVRNWGGITMHDVINNRFAMKAIEKGADGLIPVAAGAGGHAGALSPFALMQEIREWFDGLVALSGSIAHGASILAAQALRADFAYAGSAFIATKEANADAAYKQGIVEGSSEGIVYTNLFTGVHGNYLRSSIEQAGLDPDNLPVSDPSKMNFGSGGNTKAKAWKDIWGSGQGVGAVKEVGSVEDLVARMEREYHAAKARLVANSGYESWGAMAEAAE